LYRLAFSSSSSSEEELDPDDEDPELEELELDDELLWLDEEGLLFFFSGVFKCGF